MTTPTLPKRAALEPPSFRPVRTIGALVLREMTGSYGRSPGGYIWAILQPLGMVLFLSVGFSLILSAPSLGKSFTLFYATGYLPFLFYLNLTGKISQALRYSKSLLVYPGVTWIDAILARLCLNLVTSLVVFFIVFGVILTAIETRTILSIGPIFTGLTICVLVGIAAGLANVLLFGLVPVWEQVWDIISRPLFLASGILFLYEDMPGVAQDILWWNPLLHGISLVRAGFYPTYRPEYVSYVFCFGTSLTVIALTLIFLRAKHKTILEK